MQNLSKNFCKHQKKKLKTKNKDERKERKLINGFGGTVFGGGYAYRHQLVQSAIKNTPLAHHPMHRQMHSFCNTTTSKLLKMTIVKATTTTTTRTKAKTHKTVNSYKIINRHLDDII